MRYYIRFKSGKRVCVKNVTGLEFDSESLRFYDMPKREAHNFPHSSDIGISKAYLRMFDYIESDLDNTISLIDVSELFEFAKTGV